MPNNSRPQPIASVIIPAHNEAKVIGRCLSAFTGEDRDDFEVVVVSNGSEDGTAGVARRQLRGVPNAVVESIDEASKIAALRMGDEVAKHFPRIYLDADVSVSGRTLRDLAVELRDDERPMVGAPSMVVDTSRCGWIITAYHNVWTRLPYVADGVIGAGIYGVNAAGGVLKGDFPDVVNDDAYVRGIFTPDQRVKTRGVFMISAPRTIPALVRRRARVHIGNVEVESEVSGAGRSTTRASLLEVARGGEVPPLHILAYLVITMSAMLLSSIRRLRGSERQWSTDSTSREIAEVSL